MAVLEYSLKRDGNKRIQTNFKVKEFASKDGADQILIDRAIVDYLQAIRDCTLATSCHIASGYRTIEYNKKIGGSATSKHCLGKAADFNCRRVLSYYKADRLACVAELLGIPGIEKISDTNLHIDVRSGNKWFSVQKQQNGVRQYVTLQQIGYNSWFAYTKNSLHSLDIKNPFSEPTKTVAKGSRGSDVRWVQYQLILAECLPLLNSQGGCNIDGNFGGETEKALMKFQRETGLLEVDGRCGKQSRMLLKKFL